MDAPKSDVMPDVLSKGYESAAQKKDDDVKTEKVNKAEEHKADIADAFSGHLKLNPTKNAGKLPENVKETSNPSPG